MSLVEGVGRLAGLYGRTTASRSLAALLIANAIPLVGVVFLGWSLWTVLVVYWLENGVVGLWNIPRILLAEGELLPIAPTGPTTLPMRRLLDSTSGGFGRVATAIFFTIHYGLFWVGHGFFVFALPMFAGFSAAFREPDVVVLPDGTLAFVNELSGSPFGEIAWSSVALGAVAMVISHGASFFLNYIGQGEYKRASALRQAFAPYGRVIVLHVTILVGAFAVAILGAPILLIVILVVLKSALDLRLHLAERVRLGAASEAPLPTPQPPADPRSTNLP